MSVGAMGGISSRGTLGSVQDKDSRSATDFMMALMSAIQQGGRQEVAAMSRNMAEMGANAIEEVEISSQMPSVRIAGASTPEEASFVANIAEGREQEKEYTRGLMRDSPGSIQATKDQYREMFGDFERDFRGDLERAGITQRVIVMPLSDGGMLTAVANMRPLARNPLTGAMEPQGRLESSEKIVENLIGCVNFEEYRADLALLARNSSLMRLAGEDGDFHLSYNENPGRAVEENIRRLANYTSSYQIIFDSDGNTAHGSTMR